MPRGKKGDAQVKARAEEKRVKADFLSQRRTVCLVRTKEGKTARGTGVAVTYRGLTCVLTTYAALPDRAACDACVCVFDFEASLDARPFDVALRPLEDDGGFFFADPAPEHDVALVALAPLDTWPGARVRPSPIGPGEDVAQPYFEPRVGDALQIVVHPYGWAKMVAKQTVRRIDAPFLYYDGEIDPGAAGAPVLVGARLVALHRPDRSRPGALGAADEGKGDRCVLLSALLKPLRADELHRLTLRLQVDAAKNRLQREARDAVLDAARADLAEEQARLADERALTSAQAAKLLEWENSDLVGQLRQQTARAVAAEGRIPPLQREIERLRPIAAEAERLDLGYAAERDEHAALRAEAHASRVALDRAAADALRGARAWLWAHEPAAGGPGVLARKDGRVCAVRLPGRALGGALPKALAFMSELGELDLRENALTGAVPAALGRLTALRRLDLSRNWLRGPVPEELGALAQLRVLRLDENALTGQLPASLGALASLRALHLEFNQLSGAVPVDALSRLGELRELCLHQNYYAEKEQLEAHVSLTKLLPRECMVSILPGHHPAPQP